MSLRRYPAYKDSGVEWLGEVPEHWAVKRLRFVAELNPSKAEISSLDRSTTISFLPMDAIGDAGSLRLDQEKLIGEVETGYTYFRDGDVTIAKITPCYENGKGAIMRGLINGIGFGTTELIVARPTPSETIPAFLHYLFVSPDFRSIGESHMYGAGGQKRVPDEFVRNFETAFPPLPEQTRIAAFLDRETAKIDGLVAEQQRLIDLLKEKRQAVISHAVTKGLNPAAPMKPSGIEWLGDVPAHWRVKKLKYLLRPNGLVRGPFGGDLKKEIFQTSGHKVYEQKNAIYRDITLGESYVSDDKFAEMRRFHAAPGDYIMSCSGTIGKTYRLPHSAPIGIINQALLIIRFVADIKCEYADWIFDTDFFFKQILDNSQGGAMKNLVGMDEFTSIGLPVPPTDEQLSIAAFLQCQTMRFDELTDETERVVGLLQERRTALISAAVTGQIDVRHLAEASAA